MKRKTWYWIIGVTAAVLVICGGFVGLGLLIAGSLGGDDSEGLGFGEAVAVVRVEGVIVPGEAPPPNPFSSGDGAAFSQQIIDYLKRAEENEDVKAVVLYVDSPGGSVYASDEIYLQIKEMTKPVVASMSSLAASGGYYISAPADEIWASPHTLTCSIGVIFQFINVEEFSEEYGVTAVTVTSGKFKDIGNPFREFTEEDEALIQDIVDEAYNAFVEIVAEGRNMSQETVRELADGRVCTGKQAQAVDLVDELGYLPEAIDRAAELGGIDGEPRTIEYDREPTFFEAFGAGLRSPSPVQELRQLLHFHAGSPLMYLYVP